MDPAPRDPEDFHKIWTTSGSSGVRERKILSEFADEDKYRAGKENTFYKYWAWLRQFNFPPSGVATKNHSLELPFTGSANVVFNGSFFYYNEEKDSIVKLDLATRDLRCLQIPTGRQRHRVILKYFISRYLIIDWFRWFLIKSVDMLAADKVRSS